MHAAWNSDKIITWHPDTSADTDTDPDTVAETDPDDHTVDDTDTDTDTDTCLILVIVELSPDLRPRPGWSPHLGCHWVSVSIFAIGLLKFGIYPSRGSKYLAHFISAVLSVQDVRL